MSGFKNGTEWYHNGSVVTNVTEKFYYSRLAIMVHQLEYKHVNKQKACFTSFLNFFSCYRYCLIPFFDHFEKALMLRL